MAEKIEVGVVVTGADKATQQIDGIDKATDNLGTGISGATGALDKLTGGAVSGFRKAAQGTKVFIKGLKLTKVALISTGIGAIVVAVGALVGFFLKTNKGAKMLKVGLAALGAIVERVTGYFQAAGAFIVGLFTGGVTEAVSAYNAEIEKLPGSMMDAIKKAAELERRTQALRVSQRDLTVQFAEGRAQIKEYNMIAEDTTRGLEERLEAAQKAIDIERELMAARQAQAQEEFDIAKERAAQSDSSEDDLDNLATLEANLINIRTESAEMQTTLNNKLNIIRAEAKRKAKEEADAIALAEQEKRDAYEATLQARRESISKINEAADQARTYTMSQQETELDALEQQYMKLEEAQLDYIDQVEENQAMYQEGELARAEAHLKEMETRYYAKEAAIVDKYKQQEQDVIDAANKKIEDREKAKALAIRSANMSVVQAGFQALQSMAKTEEGQKKLAIAQILVNQGVAMSQAIAGATTSATATGPGAFVATPLFIAQALAIVLGSFASIKGVMNQAGAATDGLDTSMPNLGGGGGGGGTVGGGGGEGPQLALTPDLAQSFNQALGSSAVQAYVIQQDIADADALAATLQNQASLGGG